MPKLVLIFTGYLLWLVVAAGTCGLRTFRGENHIYVWWVKTYPSTDSHRQTLFKLRKLTSATPYSWWCHYFLEYAILTFYWCLSSCPLWMLILVPWSGLYQNSYLCNMYVKSPNVWKGRFTSNKSSKSQEDLFPTNIVLRTTVRRA